MKHAYLIIAHSNWKQLEVLIRLLDDLDNDIYIHIDRKVKEYPKNELIASAMYSKIRIFSEYKVYWGSYKLVEVELLLFSEAHKKHYDYYHLMSGMDLPIKPINEINDFFIKNKGKEFVHFDTDERISRDKEITRRTKLYHLLQNYRRRYKLAVINSFFTWCERILMIVQIIFRVDRMKHNSNIEIRYGSQWCSITDDLVDFIIKNKEKIKRIFKYTNCADELFIQTIVHNSSFRAFLYNTNYDDNVISNMRLIDMKDRGANGNPYTWLIDDKDEIAQSPCLFARKFDENMDTDIIRYVISLCKNNS